MSFLRWLKNQNAFIGGLFLDISIRLLGVHFIIEGIAQDSLPKLILGTIMII